MPRAEWSFIGDVLVSYPTSQDEQRRILSTIRSETATLDDATIRTQHEIDLMREYRTRLIADVVTGKLDVRHVAPESPASVDGQAWRDDVEAALADDETVDIEGLDDTDGVDGGDE